MYNAFIDIVNFMEYLVSRDVLVLMAICILAGFLVYQIIMATIARHRKKTNYHFNMARFALVNRWVVLSITWLFAAFIIMVTLLTQTADVMLFIVFLVLAYVMERLFFAIYHGGQCCCCEDDECPECTVTEKKAEKQQPKQETKKEEVKEEPREKVKEAPIKNNSKEKPVKVRESVSVYMPSKEEETKEVVQKETPVKKQQTSAKATPVKRSTPASRAATKAATERADDIEKKNEKIGELGEKIEKQRMQAERRADYVEEAPEIEHSSKRVQEALASVEETAQRMDDLQRRMDALRQTTTVRDVKTSENVSRKDYSSHATQKSTLELLREKESLKKQYETLQIKLEQMEYERLASERISNDYGYDDRRAEVGYYNSDRSFQRSARPENLSKIPSRNKFDEAEVKAALSGLKLAIEDKQRQIDERDEQ